MIRAMATPPDPSLRDEQVERTRLGSAERAPAPLLDGLPEEERRRAVAAVYSQHSAGTCLLYRDSFGLWSREAGETAAWTVGLVLDDLERRAQQRAR